MIIEGLCTTRNEDGTINLAPMGPVVDRELTTFLFRPFQSSRTYANLRARHCGIFHVTDDVSLLARAAVGDLPELPEMFPAQTVDGMVIAKTCRWYEFEVVSLDDSRERAEVRTRVTHAGRLRDVWGFNRASHAVIETAILATRLHLIPVDEIVRQLDQFRVIVEKTAGDSERDAFAFLEESIRRKISLTG